MAEEKTFEHPSAGGNDPDAWIPLLRLDDVWQGEMVAVRAGRADVLLVNLGDGELRAYDNRCPHAGSRLSEGRLEAVTLRCGAHLWEFDARSGHGVNPKNCRLRRYRVRVVNGTVWVQLADWREAQST